jgi:hypothetical protein
MSDRKNFTTAILLSLLAGPLGIDRFYLGCTWTGVLKLLTLGGLGIWGLIDLIRLATGSKLCGGFKWDTETGGSNKMSGGSEVDDTMCIILAITVGLMLLYFFVFPWIKKTYGKKEEKELQ